MKSLMHVVLKRNTTESSTGLVRRFSRKMQEAGVIIEAKSRRYHARPPSKLAQKNYALRRLIRRKEMERLRKLGKI